MISFFAVLFGCLTYFTIVVMSSCTEADMNLSDRIDRNDARQEKIRKAAREEGKHLDLDAYYRGEEKWIDE